MDPIIQYAIMKFQNMPQNAIDALLRENHIDFTQSDGETQTYVEQQVNLLNEKLRNTNLSESDQASLKQQIAMVYAKSGDLKSYRTAFDKIGLKSISQDLLFSLNTQIMRLAIAQNDHALFKENLQAIQEYNNISFDSKSQLQIYQALEKLLYTNIMQLNEIPIISQLLTSSIQTFSAEAVMCFEEFVVMAFVIAICWLSRQELQRLIEKQMDNFSVVSANEVCTILLQVVQDCVYSRYNDGLNALNEYIHNNFYLTNFHFTIINLYKLKVYDQYLLTYNSVALSKIQNDLQISSDNLIAELEYFIFKQQLKAKIDRDMLVRQNEDECSQLFMKFYRNAEALVNKIETIQKSK